MSKGEDKLRGLDHRKDIIKYAIISSRKLFNYYYYYLLLLFIIIFIRWRNSFLISLVCGVPVMIIMIYFHWFKHTMMEPLNQTPVFRGVSLDNLLLFLLCTPVQVRVFFYLYVFIQNWYIVGYVFFRYLVVVIFTCSPIKPWNTAPPTWMCLSCWPQPSLTFIRSLFWFWLQPFLGTTVPWHFSMCLPCLWYLYHSEGGWNT